MADEPATRDAVAAWPLLRRTDQAVTAGLVAVGLALMAAVWLHQGGHRGGLMEIDGGGRRAIDFRVDPNTAGWPELALLPGIGETLARRIVESRERDGPYRDAEDLRRVKGIGPVKVDRIRPYLAME